MTVKILLILDVNWLWEQKGYTVFIHWFNIFFYKLSVAWNQWHLYVLCICFCDFQGQFISEYVGDLIDEQEARRRLSEAYRNNVSNFYMMNLDSGRWVIA